MEVGEDVPLFYDQGQSYCEFCKKDLATTKAVRAHNKKYHLGKYKFQCDKCKKGFWTRQGLETHKNACLDGTEVQLEDGVTKKYAKIQCGSCDKTFVSKKCLSKHVKDYHSAQNAMYACEFCKDTKGYSGKTLTLLNQHKKGCPDNPNRIVLECEVCKKFTSYWAKKINDHKKKVHGWKLH